MPYPRSENKVHNLIIKTLELEEQAGKLLLEIDENKKKIQKYFDEKGTKEIRIPVSESDTSKTTIVCKKTERANIKYDVEKLKQKLDNELFMEVTKRSYYITDIDAMIKLMKDNDVRARDFKALIDAKVTVDREALKQLYDAKEITMSDLKGTYSATISKSIKISEETGEKD